MKVMIGDDEGGLEIYVVGDDDSLSYRGRG